MIFKPTMVMMVTAIILMMASINNTQKLYTGVWRGGTDGYYLWAGVNWADFNTKWAELGKSNLRLIRIETYLSGSTRLFIGLWREGTDAYALTPYGYNWT